MNVVDEICELFANKGHDAYVGEPVSQLEHALQAAYHAEQSGAADPLVVAALLHDVGHLITNCRGRRRPRNRHAARKARPGLAANHCGPEVTEPVRLHVAAKRYLWRPTGPIWHSSRRRACRAWGCKADRSRRRRSPSSSGIHSFAMPWRFATGTTWPRCPAAGAGPGLLPADARPRAARLAG